MKANTIKNLKYRKSYYSFEFSKKINNFLIRQLLNSSSLSKKKRILYLAFTHLMAKNSNQISKSHLKNKCVFTGRNKSVNKTYSLSRIALRNLMGYGIIPGYRKAVW